jgi:long-subunit acyl-CoA synthetase (AMP-forming)
MVGTMTLSKLILDQIFDHEAAQPNRVFLTQPIGGGRVVDYSWGQVLDQSRRMAAHLQGRGLPRGARIAILSKNCAHFFMAELAIWLGGYTTVAIFPTETADTVRFVLEHSEASLLFVGKLDSWPQQQRGVPAGLPCIAFPLAPPTEFDGWDAIVAHTAPLAGRPQRAADELAMLIYTSGSTGQPKGVMSSFGALSRAAEGIAVDTRKRVGAGVESRMLSYLPLAHSFERSWVEGVFAKMPPAKLDRLLSIPILGRLVARKVLKGLGLDAVVQAGSGSAPLPPELIRWYRRLGLKLFEGYGMTEDNSYSHTSTEQASEPGFVGVSMAGVQVKLSPEGEILIKSPAQFSGYYKQPELTAASFTDDGFFRTGDRGERRPDGLLKITGRTKELFKTAKGKYVAPAPIENRLNAHAMVELSLVSGVGQAEAYALVVPAEGVRARLDDEAVRTQVQREMEQLLRDVNRELSDYERLHMIVVVREPWSIENGFLTPTMKIKRARIEAAVAPQVEGWYAGRDRVQWA